MAEMNIIEIPVADVVPYENNPRRNAKGVDAVAASVREFGFLNPIVVDENNVVICGHTRLLAAIKLGLDKIPAVVVDGLTEAQKRAYRLADNRVSETATWDLEKLREELASIKSMFDMTEFGFAAEHEALVRELSEKRHRCPRCGHEW